MSLITDFRKTVRSRLGQERPVEAATYTEQGLHLATIPIDELTHTSVEESVAGPLAEAPGTQEVTDNSPAQHEAEGASYPQAKRRRGRVAIAKSPNTKNQTADSLTPTNRRSAGALAGSGMLFATLNTRISKASSVVRLLEREGGATLPEIMAATGWQAHSIRGFLSGTVRKKLGRDLISVTDAGGLRRYRIAPNDNGSGPQSPDLSNTVVDNLSPDKTTPSESFVADVTTNEPVA